MINQRKKKINNKTKRKTNMKSGSRPRPSQKLVITFKKKVKQIYIENKAGFGNRVFDLIFAIYLYNLYKGDCIINYVLVESKHDKKDDPTLDKIFPLALESKKINFITKDEKKKMINKNTQILRICNYNPEVLREYKRYMLKLETFPKFEVLKEHNSIDNNFRLVYKMYETFSKDDKNIFINMDTSLINERDKAKIKKHTNLFLEDESLPKMPLFNKNNVISVPNPYAIIHIRYGDKLYTELKQNIKNKEKFDYFLLYKPEYYIDMIHKFLKKDINIPVIIITDSPTLVKECIMPKFIGNKNVNFLNIDSIAGFYLLCHASHIVMSCSTFSMAASYFNEKAKCDIVIYHEDKTKETLPEEDAIAPNWQISKERKYILNYDDKLISDMLKIKNS